MINWGLKNVSIVRFCHTRLRKPGLEDSFCQVPPPQMLKELYQRDRAAAGFSSSAPTVRAFLRPGRCACGDTHLATQPVNQTVVSLKASSSERCSAFWQEQRTWRVSVVSVLPRANNHQLLQNKDLQKDYCTPLYVIYLESKRKRHMKQRTELSE